NGLVLATAARFAEAPAGSPVAPNGPVGSGRAKNTPGATSGAVSRLTATFPNDGPPKSGSPKLKLVSIVTGTEPWATVVSWLVPGGTSQFGCGLSDSGNTP